MPAKFFINARMDVMTDGDRKGLSELFHMGGSPSPTPWRAGELQEEATASKMGTVRTHAVVREFRTGQLKNLW